MTTSRRPIGVANMLLRWTLARGSSKLVATDCRVVARVLFEAVVNQLASCRRVALITISAATDSGMVLGLADGIGSTATSHDTGIHTFVLVADSVGAAILVLETVGFDAALPLV